MDGHAFWTVQCIKHFHESDEPSAQAFLGKFVVVYFDDILNFSPSEAEHLQHLRKVFTVLQENKLYINLKKYNFITISLIFMGFIISSQGIHAARRK